MRQPNYNFAPQLGLAWDPSGKGTTVVRAGAGLYYENTIFNNVLFDRPLRLPNGAFLSFPTACLGGQAEPVSVPSGTISLGTDPATGKNYCGDTIGQAAGGIAAFQTRYQSPVPVSLTGANPN